MGVIVVMLVVMLVVVGVLSIDSTDTGVLPPVDLMHRVVLDPMDKYVLQWTPREKDVIFEVQVATKGYVGLGFSPNGGMKGADIILGWVDDTGNIFLHDRHSTAYGVPNIDESQDVELLGGFQNDTHTVLRFSRPWVTCDPHGDLQLSEETVRLIWSYSSHDPTNEMTMTKHDDRGTWSTLLQAPVLVYPDLDQDVKTWDLLNPNVTLPSDQSTLYWCKMFKIPATTGKSQVIGFVPVIEERNVQNVHHVLLYECHVPGSDQLSSSHYYEKWLEVQGVQCYGPSMPVSWTYCSTPVFAWAVGSQGEMYPETTGLPLGEEYSGATYFLMETHYDNPSLQPGIVDSSGLRIFYTENLRQYDAGVIMLGQAISPLTIIPPHREWLSVGICQSDCTRQGLPEGGVEVFLGVLHSHLLGSYMRLRQVRGDQELPSILKGKTFSPTFPHCLSIALCLSLFPCVFL
ncbi:MOXD1 homolog 1 [Cherax quadricarinatus]|uniref:MOXD1 homolog 1 n=1 Tax=Cherax quadricarinatus TaxID=27406 RepID=UPI00387EB607